jgi:hypothetical protein
MRRGGHIAIGVVLLLTLTTPLNAAAPKAGAKCTKKNLTATSSGKLFTCIQSGKKLVWNKGVAISKPTPTPSPSPSKPTAIGDPIGAVGSTPTPTPTPKPTAIPVVINEVAKQAFEIIQSAKQQNSNLILTYEVQNFIPKDVADAVRQNTENAVRLYSAFLDSSRQVIIHVYTEKDLPSMSERDMFKNRDDLNFFADWWSKDPATVNSAFGYPGSYLKEGCSAGSQAKCAGKAGHAGVAYPSRATSKSLDTFNLSVVPHEFFHVIQDFYRYKGEPAYFVTEESKDFSMPSLFREGGATFMQMTASHDDINQSEAVFKFAKDWMMKEHSRDLAAVVTTEDLVALLVKLENGDRSPRSYALGAAFHEWLLVNHGLDKFIALTKSHVIGKSFKDLFAGNYGMSLVDAYGKAAPHILARIRG